MASSVRCFLVLAWVVVLTLPASGEYITRIWLTHPTSDASTLMVNWETTEPGPSRVAYGPAESLGQEGTRDESTTLHQVEIPFPESGTLYYRVSTGNLCSAIYPVKSYSGDSLRIVAAADWQDRPRLDGVRGDDPHLLLSCGDMVSGLTNLAQPGDRSNTAPFSQLIDTYPALFARTPFMPVLGNHDRQIMYRLLQPPAEPIYDLEATAFRRFFPLPDPGRNWHLDIPAFDLRLIGLDLSHTPDAGTTWQSCQDFGAESPQLTWYRETMGASTQRFVITAYNEWHHLVQKIADGEWMKVAKQGSASVSGFGLFAEWADFDGLPCFNTALKTGDLYGNGGRTRFYQKAPSYLLLTIPREGAMVAEFKRLDGSTMNRTEWSGRG